MSAENKQWVLIGKTEKEWNYQQTLFNTIKDKYFIYEVIKRVF